MDHIIQFLTCVIHFFHDICFHLVRSDAKGYKINNDDNDNNKNSSRRIIISSNKIPKSASEKCFSSIWWKCWSILHICLSNPCDFHIILLFAERHRTANVVFHIFFLSDVWLLSIRIRLRDAEMCFTSLQIHIILVFFLLYSL